MRVLRQHFCVSSLCLLIGIVSLSACGGGDSHNDIPEACKTYCTFACSKVGVCENFSGSQIDDCNDSCVQTIDDEGDVASSSCQAASETLNNASCSEIERIVGLRSQEFKNLSLEDKAQAGAKLSSKICSLIVKQ